MYTVKELRQLCKDKNITGHSRMSKIELLKALDLSELYAMSKCELINEATRLDIYLDKARSSSKEVLIQEILKATTNQKKSSQSKKQKNEEKQDCAICMEKYSDGFELGCKHAFHDECIKQWLKSGGKECPLCRHVVEQSTARKLGVNIRLIPRISNYTQIPSQSTFVGNDNPDFTENYIRQILQPEIIDTRDNNPSSYRTIVYFLGFDC